LRAVKEVISRERQLAEAQKEREMHEADRKLAGATGMVVDDELVETEIWLRWELIRRLRTEVIWFLSFFDVKKSFHTGMAL